MSYLIIGSTLTLLAVGFHYLVHRGLAPAHMVEKRTPGDLGFAYREVWFPTEHGLNLYGWFVPFTSALPTPAVVLLHGWGGNAATLLPLLPSLQQAGFAVLLFDARCHGRSDNDSFTSMPRFAEDLTHALAWLKRQKDIDPHRVVVVGHSVGAGAALMVAARGEELAALVSIAAFVHPAAMMRRLLSANHIPYHPFGWYILRYVEHVIGHRYDAIAPVTTISQVQCPTLLVHGAQDTTVPAEEAYAIYAARGSAPVQLHIIAGSHDDYDDIEQQAAYLTDFLHRSLMAKRQTTGL